MQSELGSTSPLTHNSGKRTLRHFGASRYVNEEKKSECKESLLIWLPTPAERFPTIMVWTYFSRWAILNLKKIGVVYTKYQKKILNLIHQPSAKNIHTWHRPTIQPHKAIKTTQRCSSKRRWSSRCQSPSQGCWGYLLNTSSLISLRWSCDAMKQWFCSRY